jgi:hypothetical protein
MSKKSFKFFDLLVFTLITAAAECIDVYVFNTFGNQIYALSIACAMGMIAIFRWNAWGLTVPVIAGASSVATRYFMGQSVTLGLWLAYTVGYLGLAICLVWFLKKDKSTLNEDNGFKFGYYFSGYLAVELLRALCQLSAASFWGIALQYFAYDLLNVVFGLLLFLIACKQENFVVDMNAYLIKSHTGPSSAHIREQQKDSLKLESLAETDDINEAAILDGGTLSAEDLNKMDEPLRKAQHKKTKYDVENKTLVDYQKRKQDEKKGNK